MPARGLLSQVMGVASRSLTAFPSVEVSLERDGALPVSSQSAPRSARVFNVGGFSWVINEPICDVLGRAVFVTEDDSWVTWVGDGKTMKLFPGVSSGFTRTTYSLAPNVIMMLGVTSQVLLRTVCYTPLRQIPISSKNMVTKTVRKASLILEYSELSTSALIVVSVSGKTWSGTLSLAPMRMFLPRVEMSATSLRSNWVPSTTSLRWTHCAGLVTSRWRNTGIRRMPFTSSCRG